MKSLDILFKMRNCIDLINDKNGMINTNLKMLNNLRNSDAIEKLSIKAHIEECVNGIKKEQNDLFILCKELNMELKSNDKMIKSKLKEILMEINENEKH